jgi:GAF domain-containing protein/PilZ domain-containing protein
VGQKERRTAFQLAYSNVCSGTDFGIPCIYTTFVRLKRLRGKAQLEAHNMENKLTALLQFLTERAQFITGGTGAALALRDGANMICRARSGVTAPPLGAQLQTSSSFSGECLRTGEMLHCKNVETDKRVDLETCRRLGIESILVMPLYRQKAIIGLFEVFAAQPNAFTEHDIKALQRFAAMMESAMTGTLNWADSQEWANRLRDHGPRKPRRFERFDIGVPLTVNVMRAGVQELIPGRLVNLGEGGLAAVLAGYLHPGETVVLEFLLPLVRKPLRMRALVRGNDLLRHGFEFLQPRIAQFRTAAAPQLATVKPRFPLAQVGRAMAPAPGAPS